MGKLGVTVRVHPRHQVTLPKEVRCDLGVEPGDKLTFTKSPEGGWYVDRTPRNFQELVDAFQAKGAGVVTLDDVFRWRQEEDPEP